MGKPALREAAAQERRVDVRERIGREYRQFRNEFADRFAAIRKVFANLKEAGVAQRLNPKGIGRRHAIALIKSLEKLNDAWSVHNEGKPIIKMEGKTPAEKFYSLTEALGRKGIERAYLDPAGLKELDRLVNAKLAVIYSIIPSIEAEPGLPELVVTAPAPKVIPKRRPLPIGEEPVVTEEKPEERAVPPTPKKVPVKEPTKAEKERARYEAIVAKLDDVAKAEEATKKEKKGAKWHRKQLDSLLKRKKLTKRQKNTLKTRANKADTWADRRLREIQDRRVATAPAAANVPKEVVAATSTQPEIQALYDALVKITGHDKAKNDIINTLSDVWLLGETQRGEMLGHLKEARDRLAAGNEQQAGAELALATDVFNIEQAYYRKFVRETIIPIVDTLIELIEKSNLAEEDKLKAVGHYLTSKSGVHNTKTDMLKEQKRRRERADAMLKRSKISYHEMADLYQSLISDDGTISLLIGLWEYGLDHGIDATTRSEEDRDIAWELYSQAALTVADPKFDPWRVRSAEARKRTAALYLTLEGNITPTPEEIEFVERKIIPALMHSKQYRYDDSIYAFYRAVSKVAPAVPSALRPVVESVARLHSIRFVYLSNIGYQKYLGKTMIRVGAKKKKVEFKEAERRVVARRALEAAVKYAKESLPEKESDMKEHDRLAERLIKHAEGLLSATKKITIEEDRIPIESDRLYYAALALASIREVQLWRANPSMRRSLSDDELKEVDFAISLAAIAYEWNFSEPAVDPGYHFNIAGHIADAAIDMLAPQARRLTERNALYLSLVAYRNPPRALRKSFKPEPGQSKEEAEREMRELAAAKATEDYLGILISLRDKPDFGVSTASRKLSAEERAAFGLLDPRMSRDPTRTRIGGFPIMDKSTGHKKIATSDSPLDQHRIRMGESKDIAFEAQAHEHLMLSHWGEVYTELYKQNILKGSEVAPRLLRNLDVSSYLKRMEKLGEEFAAKTPKAQLRAANELLIAILDARIKELDERFDDITPDGILIIDLLNSSDPRGYYVRRAYEALQLLQGTPEKMGLRDRLYYSRDKNLFAGRVNPRQAIAIAEMALESLSDEHLKGVPIPREKIKVVTKKIDSRVEKGHMWEIFEAHFSVKGKPLKPQEIESVHWAFYTDEGRGRVKLINKFFDPVHGADVPYTIAMLKKLKTTDASGRPEYAFVRKEEGKDETLFRVTVERGSRGELLLKPVDEDITPEMLKLYFIPTPRTTKENAAPATGNSHAMVVVLRKP